MQSGLSSYSPSSCLRLTDWNGISTFQPWVSRLLPQHLKGISDTHRNSRAPLPQSHSRLASKSPGTLLLTLEDPNHLGTLKRGNPLPSFSFPNETDLGFVSVLELLKVLGDFQGVEAARKTSEPCVALGIAHPAHLFCWVTAGS